MAMTRASQSYAYLTIDGEEFDPEIFDLGLNDAVKGEVRAYRRPPFGRSATIKAYWKSLERQVANGEFPEQALLSLLTGLAPHLPKADGKAIVTTAYVVLHAVRLGDVRGVHLPCELISLLGKLGAHLEFVVERFPRGTSGGKVHRPGLPARGAAAVAETP